MLCTCGEKFITETYHVHLDAVMGESMGNAMYTFHIPDFGIPIHATTSCTIQTSRFHLESTALDDFESAFVLLPYVSQRYSYDSVTNGQSRVIATLNENQVPGAYRNNSQRDEPIVVNPSDILGRRLVVQICTSGASGYAPLTITDWRITLLLNVTARE